MGNQEAPFPEMPEVGLGDVCKLPLSFIFPNPNQPRQFIDPRALAPMVVILGKNRDVEYPIMVTPRKVNGHKVAMIVDGQRRYEAAKLAGLSQISCHVRKPMDDLELFMVSAQANLCREDMSPIEEAHIVLRLKRDKGWNQVQIAEFLGKTQGYVSNLLKYLGLHSEIQSLLVCSKIDKGVALQLATYSQEKQLELLGVIEKEVERRGKPVHPNDVAILLRAYAEEKEIPVNKSTDRQKRRKHLSASAMLMAKTNRNADVLKESLVSLSSVDIRGVKDSKIHPLDLLDNLRQLRQRLDEIIEKLEDEE